MERGERATVLTAQRELSRRSMLTMAAGASLGLIGFADTVAGKKKKKKGGKQGAKIARTAKKYKGSKYVWGGNTPRGFDCSGFTQFVVKKSIGRDITQDLKSQWKTGKRVSRKRVAKGDLIFFTGTQGSKPGITHVGISLGGRKMIHAANEDAGVIISSIDDSYYSSHFKGIRRL